MLKTVFAATAALSIAGTSLAYAQQGEGRGDGPRRFQPTIEDMRAFQAARLAALRAGLMLSAEQERNWPAFEQAMREMQKQRLDRITKMRDARREGRMPPTDPAGRMHERAARLSESGAALKRLADAMDPLYRSLDDSQKRRFAILSRSGRPGGAWQGRGRDGAGEQRGQRRTDAAPANSAREFAPVMFAERTMQGDVAVGSRSIAVSFGNKTMRGEAVSFANRTISASSVALDGSRVSEKSVSVGDKAMIGQPSAFREKKRIGEDKRS